MSTTVLHAAAFARPITHSHLEATMPSSISRDVSSVTINGQDVRVDGTTVDAATGEETDETAKEIYIAIVGRLSDHERLVAAASHAAGTSGWSATFEQVAPPLAAGDKVHVVGLALSSDPPYVWESHTVISQK